MTRNKNLSIMMAVLAAGCVWSGFVPKVVAAEVQKNEEKVVAKSNHKTTIARATKTTAPPSIPLAKTSPTPEYATKQELIDGLAKKADASALELKADKSALDAKADASAVKDANAAMDVKINAVTEKLNTVEGTVNQAKTDIGTINGKIETINTTLGEKATTEALDAAVGRITQNEGAISTLKTTAATKTELSEGLATKADMVAVKEQNDAQNLQIKAAQEAASANGAAIAAINTNLDKKATNVDLNLAKDRITALEADRTSKTYVDQANIAQDNKIAANESSITGLKNRMTTAEASISALKNNYATKAELNSAQETINANIAKAKSEATEAAKSAADSALTTAKGELAGSIAAVKESTLTFAGDTGTVSKKLTETLNVKGDGNIKITAGSEGLTVDLQDKLTLGSEPGKEIVLDGTMGNVQLGGGSCIFCCYYWY